MIIQFHLTNPIEDMYQEYLGTTMPTQEQIDEINKKMHDVKRERGFIQNKCGRKNYYHENDKDQTKDLLWWCMNFSLYDIWLEINRSINLYYDNTHKLKAEVSKVDTCTIPTSFQLTVNYPFTNIDDANRSSDNVITLIEGACGKLNHTILRCDYCIIDEKNDKIPDNEAGIYYKEVSLPVS